MRRLNFAAVRATAMSRAAKVRLHAGMDTHKNQPHDDEQWGALLRMDQRRLAKWYHTGKLVRLGPRRLFYRPGIP